MYVHWFVHWWGFRQGFRYGFGYSVVEAEKALYGWPHSNVIGGAWDSIILCSMVWISALFRSMFVIDSAVSLSVVIASVVSSIIIRILKLLNTTFSICVTTFFVVILQPYVIVAFLGVL